MVKTDEIRIDLAEMLEKTDLDNKELASNIYVKAVVLNMDGKIEQSRLPRPAIPSDLLSWYVTPMKH